ncbi:MAG: DUF1598 domain-containing protein [Thermoguttaceae bacterium]
MLSRGLVLRRVMLLAVLATATAAPKIVFAQAAGVAVDAAGVVQLKSTADQSGRLTKEQQAAVRAGLNTQAAKASRMRCISLKHLEKAIRDNSGAITDAMRYLAGLLRVRYVFFYPDSGDIVIAGPAEGWTADPAGRIIGISSGRPVIRLDDLCVALRAFPPSGSATKLIGCSIDPTKEGLAAMQRFLRSVGSNADPRDAQRTQFIVEGLQSNLGLQRVTVNGVSAKTHFAVVMVEADYRMKLIGIGLERPPVKLVSWVDRANAAQISRNALARWFFTPDYQCVRTSTDGTAMELVGDGVKVVGEDEMVASSGQRTAVGHGNKASHDFVQAFTKVYSELADRSPVYAELRNLIDLSVMAAYIQQHDFYGKANWKMEVLGDENTITTETSNAPKQVATAVNAIWKGFQLLTPVGGGVEINPLMALAPEKILDDKDYKVAEVRKKVKIELAKGRWWWD